MEDLIIASNFLRKAGFIFDVEKHENRLPSLLSFSTTRSDSCGQTPPCSPQWCGPLPGDRGGRSPQPEPLPPHTRKPPSPTWYLRGDMRDHHMDTSAVVRGKAEALLSARMKKPQTPRQLMQMRDQPSAGKAEDRVRKLFPASEFRVIWSH